MRLRRLAPFGNATCSSTCATSLIEQAVLLLLWMWHGFRGQICAFKREEDPNMVCTPSAAKRSLGKFSLLLGTLCNMAIHERMRCHIPGLTCIQKLITALTMSQLSRVAQITGFTALRSLHLVFVCLLLACVSAAALAETLGGGEAMQLSPCDLVRYLRGRTLWLIG